MTERELRKKRDGQKGTMNGPVATGSGWEGSVVRPNADVCVEHRVQVTEQTADDKSGSVIGKRKAATAWDHESRPSDLR